MKKIFVFLGLAVIAGGGAWLATRKAAPPEIPLERARRETLVSLLTTNGKVEPWEWLQVTAAREGRIAKVLVAQGKDVKAGAPLVRVEMPSAESDLAAAQATLAQARAELAQFRQGGKAADLAEIDAGVAKAELERESAQRDVASLERLFSQKAATRDEVDAARDRLKRAVSEAAGLRSKRSALAPIQDRGAAEARVNEAQSALVLVRKRIEEATIRAPRAGVVYELPVHAGAWINAGDLVARVGTLDRMKVLVYVDEPDLGKVRMGLPVSLTWDALPGREWAGNIGALPSQVMQLGSRQVGEVTVQVQSPKRDLPPGANIDARLKAQVVEGALTISKGSLRTEEGVFGAFVFEGGRLAWRKLDVGITSESRAEIRSGLKEGEAVVLPTDRPLSSGLEIAPLFP
jgi:HlyD family secretion protein